MCALHVAVDNAEHQGEIGALFFSFCIVTLKKGRPYIFIYSFAAGLCSLTVFLLHD